MNTKQRKTLRKVFESPFLFSTLLELINLKEVVLVLHKPHPQKELKKYSIENIRVFLESINIFPE
jgi:hypothetical protein